MPNRFARFSHPPGSTDSGGDATSATAPRLSRIPKMLSEISESAEIVPLFITRPFP